MQFFYEDLADYKNLENRIDVSVTLDRIAYFDIGDGEYFTKEKVTLENYADSDYLIKCVFKDGKYVTTYSPNPLTVKMYSKIYNRNIQDAHDQNMADSFKYIITYESDIESFCESIKDLNSNNCIYKVNTEKGYRINIDDMTMFYLGFASAKEVKRELFTKESFSAFFVL